MTDQELTDLRRELVSAALRGSANKTFEEAIAQAESAYEWILRGDPVTPEQTK